MKRTVLFAVLMALGACTAHAKPLASRQASMTNGVSAVFDASSGKRTVYGYVLPITIEKADAGKMLEVVAESPKPIVIELWDGEVKRTETDWFSRHEFLGSSGKEPSTEPSLKWKAEPGTVTALFLTSLPPGQKPDKFLVTYGKELRTPTEEDTAEWNAMIEDHNAAVQAQRARQWAELSPFNAVDVNGRRLTPEQYRGKVVLVDFWASWCPPCRGDVPYLVDTYGKYRALGFEIVGISLDNSLQEMRNYMQETGMTWPQIYDGKGWKTDLAVKYNVHAIPHNFLVDGNGRVIARDLRGEEIQPTVARAITALHAPRPSAPPKTEAPAVSAPMTTPAKAAPKKPAAKKPVPKKPVKKTGR